LTQAIAPDNLLAQFEAVYDPNPHFVPGHEMQRQWQRFWEEYQASPLLWFYYRTEYRLRGIELGLWDPENDPERARQEIHEREQRAELERQGLA
jgi:hypothetical protein